MLWVRIHSSGKNITSLGSFALVDIEHKNVLPIIHHSSFIYHPLYCLNGRKSSFLGRIMTKMKPFVPRPRVIVNLLLLATTTLGWVGAIAIVKESPLRRTNTAAGGGGDRVATFDPTLIQVLGSKHFQAIPNLVEDQNILVECSQKAVEAYETHGGDDGAYQGKPWKSSRIYIHGGKLWKPEQSDSSEAVDSAFIEPGSAIRSCVKWMHGPATVGSSHAIGSGVLQLLDWYW